MPADARPKQLIVDAARAYVGAPFRHQGRTKRGIDCVGVLIAVARDLGVMRADEDYTGYGRHPSPVELMRCVSNHCTRRRDGLREPGDIAVMRWEAQPQHAAIITRLPDGREGILHSYANARACVEHGITAQWIERIVGDVYELKGFV